jgi:cytochrome c-type biogenesis protein
MTIDPATVAGLLAQSTEGVQRAISGATGIPVAFFVGMVSFFSPCILPLLPGYLSYVSGVSGEELEIGAKRSRVFAGTVLFTLGFAIVFTMLGFATGSLTGSFGFLLGTTAERVAGAIVIVMGLAFLSTLYVRTLQRWSDQGGARSGVGRAGLAMARVFGTERRLEVRPAAGVAGAFPLGAAFAVGWIPCVGPGLGTILAIAGGGGSGPRGAGLLFSFSLGFGVWFVLGGLAFHRATRALAFLRRNVRVLTAIGGIFLLSIGILLVTNLWGDVMAPFRRWTNTFTPPV